MNTLDSLMSYQYKVRALLEQGRADTSTMVTVSLVVYYTEQFARSTGDVQGTIDNLVNDANQGCNSIDIDGMSPNLSPIMFGV